MTSLASTLRPGAHRSDLAHPAANTPLASKIAVVVLAGIGVALVTWATSRGVGASTDSGQYGYAARALVTEGRLQSPLGGPLVAFPPGLSLILAAGRALGASVRTADRVLDVVSILLLVPAAYRLGRETTDSELVGVGVAAASVGSAATTAVFTMMWSEPPFIVIVTVVLAVVVRAVGRRRLGAWSVVALVLGASAAVSIRYTGVTILPVIAIGVYLATRRISTTVAVTAGASAGFVAVVARNVAVGGPAIGYHEGGAAAIGTFGFFSAGVSTLGDLLVPSLANVVGYATLVMLVAGVVVAARNKQLRVVLVGGFLVSWWALLFYGHLTGIVNPNTRLLAPAVPATAVVVAYGIARLRPLWRTAGILLVATVIVASSDHDFRQASADSVSGIGFDAAYYRDSAILPAVRALPRSALIASDQAAVLSWLTGRAPIEEIPSNFLSSAGQQAAMLERLQSSFDHRSGYVAILIASDRRATLLMLASIDVHCRQQQGLLYSCS